MINTNLILLDGALLTLFFTLYVGGMVWWKPRLWLHAFPQDLQVLIQPKTKAEQRQTKLMALPFFVILLGGLGVTAYRFGFENGLLATMLHLYLVWQLINLVDLLLLDWVGMHLIDPQNPPFPGTEGAKGYRDYTFHLLGFMKGSILGLILTPVMVGIVWLIAHGL